MPLARLGGSLTSYTLLTHPLYYSRRFLARRMQPKPTTTHSAGRKNVKMLTPPRQMSARGMNKARTKNATPMIRRIPGFTSYRPSYSSLQQLFVEAAYRLNSYLSSKRHARTTRNPRLRINSRLCRQRQSQGHS
jgi:hypothetical protein